MTSYCSDGLMADEPVQLSIPFGEFTIAGSLGFNSTLDISRAVGLVNRKFWRQGLEWVVAGIRVTTTDSMSFEVSTLPSTYSFANGWQFAYDQWQKLEREAMDTTPGRDDVARYRDFKIYFDKHHADIDTDSPMLDIVPKGYTGVAGGVNATQEWRQTELVLPSDGGGSPDEHQYFMCGIGDTIPYDLPSNRPGLAGLIHEYGNVRSRPFHKDPALPAQAYDGIWTNLFNTGDNLDETLENVMLDNNSAPYWVGDDNTEPECYPGGANLASSANDWVISKTNIYSSSTAAAANTEANGFIPGFVAPCGLVRIRMHNYSSSTINVNFWLDLMPGDMHGYMARPLQEMN